MAIKYRPVQKRNPAKPQKPQLFYPGPVYSEKVSLRQLSNEVARRTSLSAVDTMAVLEACTQVIPYFLNDGAIVSLGDFGSFRVTLKGKGSATAKAMTRSHVREVKVKFRPGKEFANRMKEAKLMKEG